MMNNFIGIILAATIAFDTPQVKEYKAGDLNEKGITQLVVFSAEWCGPCKRLKADIKKHLEDLPVGRVLIVDCDKEAQLAKANKIRLYPTVLIVRDSKIINRLEGPSIAKLISATKRLK